MYESKDSGFTLFGRRIDVLLPQTPLKSEPFSFKEYRNDVSKVAVDGPGEEEKENQAVARVNDEQTNSGTSSSEQEKTLKKADKIIPCPRCNSSETKFCYFNNYNVNQPRYFCKNCQRYWTAGGTMRNVPVGAGRRKNKHLSSAYRQILVSCDGAQANCTVEGHVGADHRVISPDNATVLKFGPDAPLLESTGASDMVSDPSPCVSSMTNCSVPGSDLPMQKELVVASPMHCYPTAPWMFPAQYPSQLVNGLNPNEVQFCPTPMLGFYQTSVPFQFVPASASYWGCMPLAACQSPSPTPSSSCCSGNGSPTLGKRGRDVNFKDEEKHEKGIVAQRTSRVDDLDEASRSPGWALFGMKHSQADSDSLRKGTIFRAFKSKAAANMLSK